MKKTIFATMIVFLMMLSIVSAFDTLSVSKIDFLSNDPSLQANAFLVQGIENGGKDHAEFNLNIPSQSKATDGTITKNSGTIMTDLTDYKLQYPIKNTGIPVYQANIADYKLYYFQSTSDLSNWCAEKSNLVGASDFITSKSPGSLYVYCIALKVNGYMGKLNSANYLYNEKITVSVSGKEPKTIILSEKNLADGTEIASGNYIIAKLTSLGQSNSNVPTPQADYQIKYDSKLNNWILVENAVANKYMAYINIGDYKNSQFYYDCMNTLSAQQCVDKLNIMASMPEAQFTSYVGNIVASKESGSLILSNTPIYTYPIWTLKINADWLGIYQPVGKPKIISTTGQKFIEGKSGNIVLKVRNDANVDAAFNIGISCPSFLAINQEKVPFKAGEEKTLTEYLTAQTASQTCETCTITVKDNSNPSVQDMASQKICVTEAVQCSPIGSQNCNGNLIQTCSNVNGVQVWKTNVDCKNGCKLNANTQVPECNPDNICTEGTIRCPDGSCQESGQCESNFCKFSIFHIPSYVSCVVGKVKLIVGLIVGLLVAFIAFLLLKNNFPKDPIIVGVISALVGLLVGGAIYLFVDMALYTILIAIPIILLIKFILNIVIPFRR